MRNVWNRFVHPLKWSAPMKALHWSTVVEVYSVFNSELPPFVRQASVMPHCFCLVHNGSIKVFSVAILLGGMRRRLKHFNSSFSEYFEERITLILSASI